jgi:hypothetical protein
MSLLKKLLGLRPKYCDRLAEIKELPFGLAHQLHEDVALPAALATKATHDFFQCLVQLLGLGSQFNGLAAGSLGDTFDEFQGFFVPCTRWWHR